MSENIEKAKTSFQKALFNTIVPLQTGHIVKAADFEHLDECAVALVTLLKGHDLVSKELLNDFFVSARILKNEASHLGNDRVFVERIAQKIEYYFELILKNESPDQRVPGVPRII